MAHTQCARGPPAPPAAAATSCTRGNRLRAKVVQIMQINAGHEPIMKVTSPGGANYDELRERGHTQKVTSPGERQQLTEDVILERLQQLPRRAAARDNRLRSRREKCERQQVTSPGERQHVTRPRDRRQTTGYEPRQETTGREPEREARDNRLRAQAMLKSQGVRALTLSSLALRRQEVVSLTHPE